MKFKITIILFGLFTFTSLHLPATEKKPLKPVPDSLKIGFESISALESRIFLEFLASDELEGRDTASRGLSIARNFVKSWFKLLALKPAGDKHGRQQFYEQKIELIEKKMLPSTSLEVITMGNKRKFFLNKDFNGGTGAQSNQTINSGVVFAGYGISAPDLNYDDFKGINVKNRVVLVLAGKPGGKRTDTPFHEKKNRARVAGFRTPAENCARLLAKKGAVALFIINKRFGRVNNTEGYQRGNRIRSARRALYSAKLDEKDTMVPFFWISPAAANSMLSSARVTTEILKGKIDHSLNPHSFLLPGVTARLNLELKLKNTISANLLGMIEGSNPRLKEQYVVIGAHLDHVGINEDGYVFNGADDNASGSVGVLQLAKALANNPQKPKRSIVFALWTGEEKGLVGSRYFIHFPTMPLKRIITYINLDMIGKLTTLDKIRRNLADFDITEKELQQKFQDNPHTLVPAYTSLPSPALVTHYTRLGQDYLNLQVVPLCSHPMIGNSDHYPFAQRKIPSVFFITLGDRNVHQPSDTVETINTRKMSRIIKLVYLLTFNIADTAEPPTWIEK